MFGTNHVNTYLENYERALSGFEAAASKDPCLNAAEEVQKMINLFDKLDTLLKGQIKAKRLASLTSSLTEVKLNPSYKRASVGNLLDGLNKTIAIVGKVLFFVKHDNVTPLELVKLLGGATAGIHSMIDEHFGISVVEYMAVGAIPIAHNSAGPKMDIVLPEEGIQTGFLAQTVEEFADAILKILQMSESEKHEMAEAGRRPANRFSEQRFYEDFKAAISPILN